jgi:hypothetical protein
VCHRTLDARALVDAIRAETLAFAESDRLNDDLTCVAVKIVDAERPLAHERRAAQTVGMLAADGAPHLDDLVGIDAGQVRLRVRGDENGARRTIALDGAQFIGRLLQHVLPPGFKRIRHYGLLAPATKADRLRRARQLLAMPAANPQACEDAQAFMRRVAAIDVECCPHCSIGRWRVLQHVAADRPALNSITTPTACRGPP